MNDNDKQLLMDATADMYYLSSLYSLNGFETYAKLVSIYDGNKGDIIVIYNGTPLKIMAKFMGYNTYDIIPSLEDPLNDDKIKKAIEAKQRLWYLCTNTNDFKDIHQILIKIKCHEIDNERFLITAFRDNEDISINQQMINEGYGYVP